MSNSLRSTCLKYKFFKNTIFWTFFSVLSKFLRFTSFSNRMSVLSIASFENLFHIRNSEKLGLSQARTKSKIHVVFHIFDIFETKFANETPKIQFLKQLYLHEFVLCSNFSCCSDLEYHRIQ